MEQTTWQTDQRNWPTWPTNVGFYLTSLQEVRIVLYRGRLSKIWLSRTGNEVVQTDSAHTIDNIECFKVSACSWNAKCFSACLNADGILFQQRHISCDGVYVYRYDWVQIVEPLSRDFIYINLETGECLWDPPKDTGLYVALLWLSILHSKHLPRGLIIPTYFTPWENVKCSRGFLQNAKFQGNYAEDYLLYCNQKHSSTLIIHSPFAFA